MLFETHNQRNDQRTPRLGKGGDPRNCLRNWQPLLFASGESEAGDTRRTGHYRNGIFYTSRLLVRRSESASLSHYELGQSQSGS